MTKVDVSFRLSGETIPADHGYELFGALCREYPHLHENVAVGVLPISGRLIGNRLLEITPKSRLVLRCLAEEIPPLIQLSGSTLNLGGNSLRLGAAEVQSLLPRPKLFSRLVIIKGFTDPEPFLDAACRQTVEMGVKGKVTLVEHADVEIENRGRLGGTHSPFLRRTICIRDKNIVGFALQISELTAEESILIQENGLGGRRHFGCGVFIPDWR
ncbi:MAG: type I-MYXAN CRISPR-associated protein Cas6/Cmx6 [bacterium]